MKNFMLLFALIIGVNFQSSIAQDSSMTNSPSDAIEEEWDLVRFRFQNFNKPRIDINYGFTSVSYDKDFVASEFHDNNAIEIKLGFDKIQKYRFTDNIYRFNYSYIGIANNQQFSTKYDETNNQELRLETWRISLGNLEGFGYDLGSNIKLGFGEGNTMVWTQNNFIDKSQNQSDNHWFDYVGDSFRFGAQTESNINLKIGDYVGLNAAYERTAVFPRHMFWYWAGSEITRGIGSGLIGWFVREVGKSTPEAVPVVNFLLKNGLNYGFYELKKKNMNWPFDTEPALMFDTFKIGVSASF